MIVSEQKIAEVRTVYGRTIQDILAKQSEKDMYHLLGAIEVLVGSKIYQHIQTSPSERMVFAFVWLAREVQNGGFHQYFFNSAGDFWEDALNGLRAIGDEQGETLFLEALSVFPNSSPSRERFTRQDQLNELEEKNEDSASEHFSKTTTQYFVNPFPDWQKLFDYVKAHPEEFDLRSA